MIRNFFSTPNVIGKLMIALLFIGGVVYAGAFSGFVVETEATSCCGGETNTCGGGMDDAIFSSSGNNCDCLGGTKTCTCGNNPTCAGSTNDVCKAGCSPSQSNCSCDGTRCKKESKCNNCTNN